MAFTNTFREISIAMATKQDKMVDQLLEEAPILEMIPVMPTSDGLQHKYEEVESVTGASLLELDDVLPTASASTSLKKVDMSVIGCKMEVGEDLAKAFGGPAAYFNMKQPMILKDTGADAEASIIYNSLRAYAITNDSSLAGTHVIDATGTGSTNYSILAVKWSEGECYGLYNEEGFGRKAMLEMEALSGGSVYLNSSGVAVYGVRLKSYFGMLLANARNVASIVNIDIANSKLPTSDQMDALIDCVRGQTGGSTWLYMHPKVATALQTYKTAKLNLFVGDDNIEHTFDAWNGIPILTSYNFKNGNEARVT